MIDIYKNISDKYKCKKVLWVNPEDLKPIIKQNLNLDLLKSIKELGLKYPLILSSWNIESKLATIQTGNQRYEVLKHLGVKKIPVIFKKNHNLRLYELYNVFADKREEFFV